MFAHVLAFWVSLSWCIDAGNPGECTTAEDCQRYQGNGDVIYQCVSVRTERKGITEASQCIPNPPCAGLKAGYCPVFSGWPKIYQPITSVCGYMRPTNCLTDPANDGKDQDSLVECKNVTLPGDTPSSAFVIYQCIDSALYTKTQSPFNPNATAQLQSCASVSNDSSGDNLCNGHGTCVPRRAFSQDYVCQCNKGYDVADNCLEAVSNNCSLPGQCGLHGECRVFEGRCHCKPGYRGHQCTLCDPEQESIGCNGNGQCQRNGTCVCEPNYEGTFCEQNLGNSTASTHDFVSTWLQILVVVVILLGDFLPQ